MCDTWHRNTKRNVNKIDIRLDWLKQKSKQHGTRPWEARLICTHVYVTATLRTGRSLYVLNEKVNFILEQFMKARRGQKHNRTLSITSRPPPLYSQEREPVPIAQEAGWDPGPIWTGADNLAPTGIRSPDRPVETLYLALQIRRHDDITRRFLGRPSSGINITTADITSTVCWHSRCNNRNAVRDVSM